jgi:hypothetical protein
VSENGLNDEQLDALAEVLRRRLAGDVPPEMFAACARHDTAAGRDPYMELARLVADFVSQDTAKWA